MRASFSLASSLAAALLVAAAVRPAAAQQAVASTPARPAVAATPPAAHAVIRPVAMYRFVGGRELDMPVQVTVADSAGVLVASFRRAGDRVAHPMLVTVEGTDVVLQADTPAGQLQLRLIGQNDSQLASTITGQWSIGAEQGELRGRVRR